MMKIKRKITVLDVKFKIEGESTDDFIKRYEKEGTSCYSFYMKISIKQYFKIVLKRIIKYICKLYK